VCRAEFAWPCAEAVSVVMCESSGDWGAYNAGGSYGLFQIQAYWHLDKLEMVTGSRDPSLLFDVATNLAVADMIYRDQGWLPWTCRSAIRGARRGNVTAAGSACRRVLPYYPVLPSPRSPSWRRA